MVKLSTIYQEERAALQAQLQQATNVEQMITAIQDKLDQMQAAYYEQLSHPQLRVALPVLEAMRQSLAIAYALQSLQNLSACPEAAPTPKSSTFMFFGYLDQFLSWLIKPNRSASVSHSTFRSSGKRDYNYLLTQLSDVISAVDQVVAEMKPESVAPKVVAPLTLAVHGKLLEFLQEVLSDAQEEDVAPLRKRIRQLPRILDAYGIEVVTSYQSPSLESGGEMQRLFECEPALDEAQVQIMTLSPAFVSESNVLLRGRVIMPMKKEG